MTQLAAAVDDNDELWTLDALPTPEAPYVEVEDELVEVRSRFPSSYYTLTGETLPPRIRVRRGIAGTTAASHIQGSTLTPNYGLGGGAGASGVTISDTDPGAIGAGGLWVFQDPLLGMNILRVRNAADTGWLEDMGLINYTGGSAKSVIEALVPGFTLGTEIDENGSAFVLILGQAGTEANRSLGLTVAADDFGTLAALFLDATGVHIGASPSTPSLRTGTADPTAGAGVAASEGSIYMRTTPTAGQVWIKTDELDQNWTQLATVP